MSKKILFLGDSPNVATGFGKVNRYVIKSLIEAGHQVEVVGLNWEGGYYDRKEFPYQIYPAPYLGRKFPYQKFIEIFMKTEFDVLFVHNDINVQDKLANFINQWKKEKNFKWVAYSPVDIDYLSSSHLSPFLTADFPIVYSEFGRTVIKEHFRDTNVRVIGLGVDLDIFKPISEQERRKFRDEYFHIHDKDFLIVNTNRNSWRKDPFRTLDAFNQFLWQIPAEKRSRALLYMHAKDDDNMGSPITRMAEYIGVEKQVMVPRQGFDVNNVTDEDMNMIYNCADLIVSSSTGEGWGLIMSEAMATRRPMIMPDNTTHIEILMNGQNGFLAPTDHYTVAYGFNAWPRPTVDVEAMARLMFGVYQAKQGDLALKEEVEGMIENASKWIAQNTWKQVGEAWVKLFEEIKIEPKKEKKKKK